MVKKVLTYIILTVFLVSSAGIPLSLHLCSMMGEASFDSCEMCTEMEKQVKKSCCEEENQEGNIKIFSSDSEAGCCETTIIEKSIKDQFISYKFEKCLVLVSLSITTSDLELSADKPEFHILPEVFPPGYGSSIYLKNSTFLI
jgi:hypothetical protein